MTRPQGEPTHYLPLWQGSQGDYLDSDGGEYFPSEVPEAIPAERVTVAPEPYTPKAGDRVVTTLGFEATILAAESLLNYIPVRFHTPEGDTYGKIHVDRIDQAIQ